jgi:oxygen-independent coproporphyrinogen-3 oxidase
MAIGRDGSGAQMMSDYLDTLLLELAHYGDKLGKAPVSSVFFGGGTPSLLPPDIVGRILERIDRTFQLETKAEISLEANPESLSRSNKAADFLAAGINRLSIGIQSLDDSCLRVLGRPHKVQDSLNAVLAARTAGFTNISVDLMWGLPGQGVRQWLQTLKDVVRLAPEHISSYCLTLEPGTPLELDCDAGRLVLPPERDQNIMFMEGAAFMEKSGYLHYEISNFARMGFQCRHNLGYWEGEDYLGLGPSATSTIAGARWTNPASLAAWGNLAREKSLGKQAEILAPGTRLMEHIMLRLRTSRGLRLKAYKQLTGRDFLKDNQRLVQAMHENGLIRIRNGYLSLTRSGMVVSNAIISNIFERVEQTVGARPPRPGQIELPKIESGQMAIAGNARAGNEEIRKIVWPLAEEAK